MKLFICILILFFPWRIRRLMYIHLLGYKISDDCFIGFTLVAIEELVMQPGSKIGHLNIVKGLKLLSMSREASLGSLNWITGFPKGESQIGHFNGQLERDPSLYLGEHSAITSRHYIDCTDKVTIGKFTTLAGIRSQVLTHSIDIKESKQHALSIEIGDYCFIGTSCVFLKGSTVPNCSVVGAMSLINKSFDKEYVLYAGVPARELNLLSNDYAYFKRKKGYVV